MLVRRYQAQAVRVADLVVRDRALAEDIVEAAFRCAYKRIGRFDAARPFGPWFLRSVVNDALKAAARRARSISLEAGTKGEAASLAALLAEPPAVIDYATSLESGIVSELP